MTLTNIDGLVVLNLMSKGVIKSNIYYAPDKKNEAILHARKGLFSLLAHYITPDKPVIFDYSESEELLSNGEYSNDLAINTYYLNPLDCEIGDRCKYEPPDEFTSNHFELDHDHYHFKKIDNDSCIWERVI